MDQESRPTPQFAEAEFASAEQVVGDEGHGLDRLVTAVAFVATVALILLSPLAS